VTAILGTTQPSAAGFGTGQIYHGIDGIQRYVEFYDNPVQAYGKVLTNALLNDLGGHAPHSEVFQWQGRAVYAATYAGGIPGPIPKNGLTKERADAMLNNCVVDILLKNWDAVGDDRRHLAMTADGQVIRANNDVALPTQTKGRRNPPKQLDTTADYLNRLFDPRINPAYAAVARAAGYDRVRDVPTFHAQLARIEELLHRHGGWDNYVATTLPGLARKDRRGLVSMLESRTNDLRKLAARYHAKRDELNRYLPILRPTAPTAPSTWTDPNATAVFTSASGYPRMLNGMQMTPWEAPTTLDGWAGVAGQNPRFNGIPFRPRPGNHAAASALILEPDGRIWMTEPSNHYGGETCTFPKGKTDPGLSLQQTAIKEVYEETGLQVELTGMLGDYHSDGRSVRYYIARRVGGTPEEMGWETQAQYLMPLNEAATTVESARDQMVVRDLANKLSDPASHIAWPQVPAAMPQPAAQESPNSSNRPTPPAPTNLNNTSAPLPALGRRDTRSATAMPTAASKGKQPSVGGRLTRPTATIRDIRDATAAYEAIRQRFITTQDPSITGSLTEPVVGLPVPTRPQAQLSARHQALFNRFTAEAGAKTAENDQQLGAWLDSQGITRVPTSGRGNDCLIRALLHHATGNYLNQFDHEVDQYRSQLEQRYPGVGREQLNAFSPETQFLVEQINQRYGVNLRPAFVQSSQGGAPYVTLAANGTTPVPIWHSNNHYQAMTMAPGAAGSSVMQP
jgi:ADP-ribose pyrophosphatase YjhB (NUDIX family)